MKVRVTHLDGKIPNLALMRISAHHKALGDEVHFSRQFERQLFEPEYDRVYGSAIFKYSVKRIERFRQSFPDAILGGTGTYETVQVEDLCPGPEAYDYSIYPDFRDSIGFTARGCRLRCGFCVVPSKEGKPRSVSSVYDIWRGEPYTRNLYLLDNDFFGQAEDQWRERVEEIVKGNFKICFDTGINIRLINEESARAMARMQYRDDNFKVPRIYTAWDNLKDFKIFFKGVEAIKAAGIPPKHLLVYMLVGFTKGETMEEIEYRHKKITEFGAYAFPMVYDRSRPELRAFARWAIRFRDACTFAEYKASVKKASPLAGAFDFSE